VRIIATLAGTDGGRSGLSTYVRAVLPRLARLSRDAGGELLVAGTRADLEAYQADFEGAEMLKLPAAVASPALSASWHALALTSWARQRRADVLLQPAANRRVGWLRGLPSVAVVHDLAPCVVRSKHGFWRDLYVRNVIVRALRRQTALVAVSAATRSDMARILGVPSEGIRVVPNGVDVARFRPRASSSGSDTPYILYAARLEHPGKNHVALLEAFATSRARRDHRLVFAGEDWGAQALLERRVAKLGLTESVRFLGRVPDAQFVPLVAGAAAVAMVGIHEGFGLPALEALACGVPVVASKSGALPEVVGDLGVLCDPSSTGSIAQALDRCLTPQQRQRATLEGPAWARRWSWDATALGVWNACVGARGVA